MLAVIICRGVGLRRVRHFLMASNGKCWKTGLVVKPLRPLYVGEWRPIIRGVSNQIIALFMLCKASTLETTLSDEHDQALWIEPSDYTSHDMMDPDDEVIKAYLKTL